MEIKLKTRSLVAELIIETGSAKIEEDVAGFKNGEPHISNDFIENLIDIAREMNRFNKKSDVDFVKMIYDAFLNDSERAQFLSDVTDKLLPEGNGN